MSETDPAIIVTPPKPATVADSSTNGQPMGRLECGKYRKCTRAALGIGKKSAVLLMLTLVSWRTEAADRFAMTCVENKTNLTVNYTTRWGRDGSERRHSINPGRRISHTWEYDSGRAGRSPNLYIRFDDDLSSRMKQRQYVLESYRAPQTTDCSRYGREYQFRYDGSAQKFIDLVSIR